MVKRYELNFCDRLEESKDGYLVYFEDYQKLEKEFAELKEQMRWRDVRDELPEESARGDFLTFVDNGRVKFFGIYSFGEHGCAKWIHLRVTHWIPLPTPPNNK